VLRELAAEKNRAFRQSFVGRSLEMITLQAGGDGWTEALSDNFLKVRLAGQYPANEILQIEITGFGNDDLKATMQKELSLLALSH
jgi:tRNA A37 methylthiotransferase MiaB